MRQAKVTLLSLMVVLICGSAVQADWHQFLDRFTLDKHRNNCWPKPFVSVDRRAAIAPFQAMVRNGWKRQNTLGSHDFNPDTNQLTESGKLKTYWILTQAPEEHRTIYVVTDIDPEASETRLASVQESLDRMANGKAVPAVVATNTLHRNTPAEYVDAINRALQASTPSPRLPGSVSGGG